MKINIKPVKPDAKAVLAKYKSFTLEQLIEAIRETAPFECDDIIFSEGTSAAPVFATNMYATEFLCELLRKMTGARIDWHYFGGRVNMLLHPDDSELISEVENAVEMVGISSSNYPKDSFYARVYEIKREEIVSS